MRVVMNYWYDPGDNSCALIACHHYQVETSLHVPLMWLHIHNCAVISLVYYSQQQSPLIGVDRQHVVTHSPYVQSMFWLYNFFFFHLWIYGCALAVCCGSWIVKYALWEKWIFSHQHDKPNFGAFTCMVLLSPKGDQHFGGNRSESASMCRSRGRKLISMFFCLV